MIYVGVDIVEVDRIRKAFMRWGKRFADRLFTPEELSFAYKMPSLAANFAAKEAAMKAIGKRIPWKEIEVLRDNSGKPQIRIRGEGKDQRFEVSISHCREYAIAVVIRHEDSNS